MSTKNHPLGVIRWWRHPSGVDGREAHLPHSKCCVRASARPLPPLEGGLGARSPSVGLRLVGTAGLTRVLCPQSRLAIEPSLLLHRQADQKMRVEGAADLGLDVRPVVGDDQIDAVLGRTTNELIEGGAPLGAPAIQLLECGDGTGDLPVADLGVGRTRTRLGARARLRHPAPVLVGPLGPLLLLGLLAGLLTAPAPSGALCEALLVPLQGHVFPILIRDVNADSGFLTRFIS
jgi:hypothetical protein